MNRKLVVLILLIAFAGSTLLIGETEDVGRPLSPAEQEARRSRINHRSFDEDWELLSRNYETYRRMSEEEREKYRNLYRELQNDRNQRQLDQLLDHYYEWLSALTPHERDSIRKANGIEQKLTRIRELWARDIKVAEDEAKKRSEELLSEVSSPPKGEAKPATKKEQAQEARKLASATDEIFEIIEKRMLEIKAIDDAEWEHLKELTGSDRHRQLILEYLPNRWHKTSERVFDGATCDQIAQVISDRTGGLLPESEAIPDVVAMAVLSEFKREYEELKQDPAKFKKVVARARNGLPEKDRDEFDKLSDDEKEDYIAKAIPRRIFNAFVRSGEFRPGGPGGGPPPRRGRRSFGRGDSGPPPPGPPPLREDRAPLKDQSQPAAL